MIRRRLWLLPLALHGRVAAWIVRRWWETDASVFSTDEGFTGGRGPVPRAQHRLCMVRPWGAPPGYWYGLRGFAQRNKQLGLRGSNRTGGTRRRNVSVWSGGPGQPR